MAYRSARKERSPVSRNKRRSRDVVATIGRWILAGIVCLVVGKWMFSFGGKVVMLAHVAQEQRQDIVALREETERLREQNAALREEMRKLYTPSGIILEARKQGYGFPGERLLVIEPTPEQATR